MFARTAIVLFAFAIHTEPSPAIAIEAGTAIPPPLKDLLPAPTLLSIVTLPLLPDQTFPKPSIANPRPPPEYPPGGEKGITPALILESVELPFAIQMYGGEVATCTSGVDDEPAKVASPE